MLELWLIKWQWVDNRIWGFTGAEQCPQGNIHPSNAGSLHSMGKYATTHGSGEAIFFQRSRSVWFSCCKATDLIILDSFRLLVLQRHIRPFLYGGRCCRWWQDSLWAPAIICIYSGSKPHNHVDLLYLFVYTSETRYVEGWCQILLDLATISWFLLCSLMHVNAAPLCLAVAKHGTNLHWLTCVV